MKASCSVAILAFMLGCQQRGDSPTIAQSTSAPAATPKPVVLTPLASSTPLATSVAAPSATLPPLTSLVQHTAITATVRAPAKAKPMRACCDALRKQSQLESAQAAAVCDGVVAALDDSTATPQLEQMLKPILATAPLPEACKGL